MVTRTGCSSRRAWTNIHSRSHRDGAIRSRSSISRGCRWWRCSTRRAAGTRPSSSGVRTGGSVTCKETVMSSTNLHALHDTRRRFMTHFAGIGLGATLAPGILWARIQDQGASRVTIEMVTAALKLAGIEATEAERQARVNGANQSLRSEEHTSELQSRLH